MGLDADAYSRFGMRPARYDLCPAITASRIASAMRTVSSASAIAVFIRTPSAPSSIAIAASEAVPTPASPMIVDAGVGTASDAAIAMELGADGVLMTTAIDEAEDAVLMAEAMRDAVNAGTNT